MDCEEGILKGLLSSVPLESIPIDELVSEVESRNRLKLLLPFLESTLAAGNQQQAVYNALAKIYIGTYGRFLSSLRFRRRLLVTLRALSVFSCVGLVESSLRCPDVDRPGYLFSERARFRCAHRVRYAMFQFHLAGEEYMPTPSPTSCPLATCADYCARQQIQTTTPRPS